MIIARDVATMQLVRSTTSVSGGYFISMIHEWSGYYPNFPILLSDFKIILKILVYTSDVSNLHDNF